MNRRQHKRRIYKRIGHQFTYCPFGGSVEGLQKFYGEVAEVLRMLNENPAQARAIYGTKDTQAQAAHALILCEGAGHQGRSNRADTR